MPILNQVYHGTYLARPVGLVSRPDLLNVSAYPDTDTPEARDATLIAVPAIPYGPEYPFTPHLAIDTAAILFLNLSAVGAGTPLPPFPNLRAVHVRPGSAFVPAPVVIHSIDAGKGPEWSINPGLGPRLPLARYARIKRLVLVVRATCAADIANSYVEMHEWVDVFSELGMTVAALRTRRLEVVLRIVPTGPPGSGPPPAPLGPVPPPLTSKPQSPRYSALVDIGKTLALCLPTARLFLDAPEKWELSWLGFNYFSQQPTMLDAFRAIATEAARVPQSYWKTPWQEYDAGQEYDAWRRKEVEECVVALEGKMYAFQAREEKVWQFEAGCR